MRCRNCKKEKPKEEFGINPKTNEYRSCCADCRMEISTAQNAKRKEKKAAKEAAKVTAKEETPTPRLTPAVVEALSKWQRIRFEHSAAFAASVYPFGMGWVGA